MIRIAVDTVGGDFGVNTTVYGACLAMEEQKDLSCLFFGSPSEIKAALPEFSDMNRIKIIESNDEITDEDHALKAVRRKQNSALVRGIKAVSEGQADSFISAGSSGAIYLASMFYIGTIEGIERPAAVSILPTVSKESPYYLLIDAGANIASKPKYLSDYGKFGSAIAKQLLGVTEPRVGLLNIGTEPSKGDDFRKAAYANLEKEQTINFIGNVEPTEILKGTNEIVLTDGFTGNILLKSIEGTSQILLNDLLASLTTKEALDEKTLALVEQAIQQRIKRFTNEDIGGGFILGIKAPIVITHGSADEKMFKNSVQTAARLAVNNAFKDY